MLVLVGKRKKKDAKLRQDEKEAEYDDDGHTRSTNIKRDKNKTRTFRLGLQLTKGLERH